MTASDPTGASPRLEVSLTFTFDAAHSFGHAAEGHRYGRLHGHSFEARVHVAGSPDPVSGFVVDFDRLREATSALRAILDHALLNEIPGLEVPSLERLALWIAERLARDFPGLTAVEVGRPSIGERCLFRRS